MTTEAATKVATMPRWRSNVPTIGTHNRIFGAGVEIERMADPGHEYDPANSFARSIRETKARSAKQEQREERPPQAHMEWSGGVAYGGLRQARARSGTPLTAKPRAEEAPPAEPEDPERRWVREAILGRAR